MQQARNAVSPISGKGVLSVRPGTLPGMRVVTYLRVSSLDQAQSGLGLHAQRDALDRAAGREDWQLVDELGDANVSGRIPWPRRPGLAAAVRAVQDGRADALAVARLDRLARRTVDALELVDELGAGLICLSPELDNTTAGGRLALTVMAAVAAYESEVAGERTREALLSRAANGGRIGRPRTCPDQVLERVLELRAAGATLETIATAMNTARIPTPAGAPTWYASHVSRLLRTQDARARRGTLALAGPSRSGLNPTHSPEGA
jgi:DNA invertase Pin-like site-specific DNA recombinase